MALVASALGLFVANTGRASDTYTYQPEKSAYTVVLNGSVTVNLYLEEAGTPSLITSDGGLYSAGVSVENVSGSAVTLTGAPPNATDFNGGSDYDQPLSQTGVTIYEFANSSVSLGNTGGGASTSYSNEIFLGSVMVTGGASLGATTFTVERDTFAAYDTLTKDSQYDLDSTNNADSGGGATYTGTQAETSPTGNFTVTVVVPEPGTLGLVAAAGASLLLRRCRKAN
jgi:hypothetical protein